MSRRKIENPCSECGKESPVLEVLGVRVPMRYCQSCSPGVKEHEDQNERERSLQDALRLAGATPRLLQQSLGSFPQDAQEALDAARSWIESRPGNLWLSGPLGVGKTGLAWAIVRELTERSVADYWDAGVEHQELAPRPVAMLLRWADLLEDLKAAFDAERQAQTTGERADPSQLLDRAKRIPVLALDDLGRERPTPWALDQLASLVEARYQRLVPTIITSNYSSTELAERLSDGKRPKDAERIVSRLIEGATGFKFTGASRRRRAS